MPTVPMQKYNSRAGIGGTRVQPMNAPAAKQIQGPRLQQMDVGAATAPAKALGEASNLIFRVAQRQQEEHDNAVATGRFNEFRQTARERLQQALSTKGAEARGALEAYHEWYDTEADKIRNDLAGPQQQIFDGKAVPYRESDLDALSRHQAREHERNLSETMEGKVFGATQEARLKTFDTDNIEMLVNDATSYIDTVSPGDNSVKKAETEAKIKVAALQAWADEDPVRAAQLLEEWRMDLGDAYYTLKDQIVPQALYREAQAEHPDDYNKQYDFIEKQKNISERIRRSAQGFVSADQAEKKSRDDDAKAETRKMGFDAFYSAMQNKKFVEARRVAKSWDPEQFSERERYLALEMTQTPSGEVKTDPAAYRGLMVDIIEGNITSESELLNDPRASMVLGPGISTLAGKIAAKNKSDTSGAKEDAKEDIRSAKERVKQMFDRGDFGLTGGSDQKADYIKADILLGMEEWISRNPGQDPTKWLDSKLDLIAAETLKGGFSDFIKDINMFQDSRQEFVEGLDDLALARDMLEERAFERGIPISEITDEMVEEAVHRKEFNEYKTKLINDYAK